MPSKRKQTTYSINSECTTGIEVRIKRNPQSDARLHKAFRYLVNEAVIPHSDGSTGTQLLSYVYFCLIRIWGRKFFKLSEVPSVGKFVMCTCYKQ
jgi:hypothetical protein